MTGKPLDFRSPLPGDLRHALRVMAGEHALSEDADALVAFRFYE
ncbi:MAG: hypothetical protein ACJ78R_06270 [Gemmatimonadaceae bacterium]